MIFRLALINNHLHRLLDMRQEICKDQPESPGSLVSFPTEKPNPVRA